MENRIESSSEKKVYSHTYDSLVRELASTMEVDNTKLFPKAEGEFNHEDIASWIGTVEFKGGKAPDIQASLSSDRGRNVLKFEVADQKTVEGGDVPATKEELIYSMALTEAKMKVVSDIAEDTYPAVAFQIKDYRKEMEGVREEILGNNREKVSLNEVVHGVLSRKNMAAAVIVGGMILSACGFSVEVNTPNTTATETQPSVTETVPSPIVETATIATPTFEPTATATPEEPTPTKVPLPEEIATTMNLNPERTYTISNIVSDAVTTKYLVDTFNNANMAKWDSEIGEWTDTTLEEKYGHLVPSDEEMISYVIYGNFFFGEQKDSWQMYDHRWEAVRLLTRSTGNIKTVESFNEDLQMNIVNVYGEVLLRDKEGKIHLLNVRLDAVNPTAEFGLWVCSVNQEEPTESDLCGSGNLLKMSSVEEELEYYGKPGQYLLIVFSTKLPTDSPPKYKDLGKGFVSTRYVSCYYDWLENKTIYQSLADALAEKQVPADLPKDFVISAQKAYIYMDMDELKKIWKE